MVKRETFFSRKTLLVFFVFLTVFITLFTVSCSSYEEISDGNNKQPVQDEVKDEENKGEEERKLNAVNLFSGEAVSFPADWDGGPVYVNFFMTT